MKLTYLNETVEIRKQPYERVRFRADAEVTDLTASRCSGCGVDSGSVHRDRCKEEQCPRCSRQLATCNCWQEPNYTFKPATKKQIAHLTRLGCDPSWASTLRSIEADAQIAQRDPIEEQRQRLAREKKEAIRKQKADAAMARRAVAVQATAEETKARIEHLRLERENIKRQKADAKAAYERQRRKRYLAF